MQGFENLWWQVLLFVPLVAVAVIVWRALRRSGAKTPRLSRFVLASVLLHAVLLFALNLWHVTVQIVELQRVLAEEELHPSYAGHQSHEPGQESWERLAELPAPEVVESPVQRRVTEQPSSASELFDVRPEIPANLAETLPPERVLVVPRRMLVAPDVASSQLPRVEQPPAALELPPQSATPPAPAAPRPEPSPEPATVAMGRQTAEAPQRLPEPRLEPADPRSLQAIDTLKPVRERLQPVLNPAQAPERAVPATPRLELTAADAAAPPRVEQVPEPSVAGPTLPLPKAATMPEPKLLGPPAELPVPSSPDRSPTLSPSRLATQALTASTIPELPALPAVTRSLKPRDSLVPSAELPPRPTLGSVQESPIELAALKLDKQVGVTLALPRTGENPLVSLPEAARTDVPSRAAERMLPVPRRPAELPNPAAAARISPMVPASATARPEAPVLAAATPPEQTAVIEPPALLARSQFAGLPIKRQNADEHRGPLESDRPPLPGLRAKRAIDAPLSLHPVATRVERYRAKGEPVLYARDDVGITASFTLRQQDARLELVRQLGGDEQTEAAVERGLAWLAAHQGPEGNWSLHNLHCKGHQCDAAGSVQSDTAATALALLPFLGAGHTHTQGKYIETVRRGMLWLVAHQKPDGDLSVAGGQAQMYSHALATITLCELFGMSGDRILHGPTTQALRFISEAQEPNSGGWRYTPRSGGDTSVVGWQLMALKSGEMAGFHVPPQVYERAGRWLDASSSGPRRELYGYQPGSGGTPVMTAEAALSRQFLGWQRTADSMLASVDYLLANPPVATARNAYYWYYATQVMFHMQGERWSTWNARLREVLLGSQVKDGAAAGSWHPRTPSPDTYGDQGGRIYETGLALLMLEVYYRHLPLYQQLQDSSR